MEQSRTQNNILFSCIGQERKDFQPFVEEHVISFVLDGTLILKEGNKSTRYNEGDIGFISKNQLVKTQKIPGNKKPFRSISVILPEEVLYKYSKEYIVNTHKTYKGTQNFVFPNDVFLKSFFESILPYFEAPQALTDRLAKLKILEVIELLTRNQKMCNILFNFQERYKLDLESYMNKNYMHNIPLKQFAKLTGRSLSTFKRDFQSVFDTTPNKWLIKKRLDLAHYLLNEKKCKPSDIYFDVGFVNFSHFSRCFKTEFGKSPSEM